jgi:hypothetical protein
MTYKDTTFCLSTVKDHTCGREFTEQDVINAERWWGGKDYPVSYAKFCEDFNDKDFQDVAVELPGERRE